MNYSLFVFVISCVVFSVEGTLPSYIKTCKRSDPDISKCITNSVNILRPKLKEGIPELMVPAIEPLPLGEIKLRSGPNQAKINANITNVKVWGPSSFELLDLKADVKRNRFIFRANIPSIYFEGDIDLDMNVLILKYKGQGPITGNFTNYKFDCIMKGDIIKQNGVNHLKFRKFETNIIIGQSFIYLANLFASDPTLNKATNEVIKDNSDLFVEEIKPVLEDALAEKFTEIANIITLTFSYDELFPN